MEIGLWGRFMTNIAYLRRHTLVRKCVCGSVPEASLVTETEMLMPAHLSLSASVNAWFIQ
jgi:hypothetical protein